MADYTSCDNSQLTDEQLFAALLTKDSSGNFAIRTTFVDACSDDAIDCNNNTLTLAQLNRKVIGIDPVCGKPAVRLANTRAAAIQNLVTYTNDGTAASGGVPVGGLYYKTGVGIHVRMS